jgi:hypothetical protein
MEALRFSGYKPLKNDQAALYLPGAAKADLVEVEWYDPDGQHRKDALRQDANGQYWRLDKPVPMGTHYRFIIDGKPKLDWLQVHDRFGSPFNLVEKASRQHPSTHGSMLDVFQHSLRLGKPDAGQLTMTQTTHFNQSQPSEAALFELAKQLPTGSIRNLLLRPIQKGGYWMENPYRLDPTSFTSREKFKAFLDILRQKGVRLYLDTALVNQGLQGPQYQSNLIHGFRSPYWDWFMPTETIPPNGFPHNAYNGFKLGVLPIDAKTGRINWDRVKLTLHNVPGDKNYQPNAHTELVLSDAAPPSPTDPQDNHSFATVQPYRFPVNLKEAQKKRKLIEQKALAEQDPARKTLLSHWKNLTLVTPAEDDSGYKWDGQIDVTKMNINNPDVRQHLTGMVSYWSRFTVYHHVQQLAQALYKAKQKNPALALTPQIWAKAIEGTAYTAMPHTPDVEGKAFLPDAKLPLPGGDLLATRLLAISPVQSVDHQSASTATQAVLSHPELARLLGSSSQWRQGLDSLVSMASRTVPWLKSVGLKSVGSGSKSKHTPNAIKQASEAPSTLPPKKLDNPSSKLPIKTFKDTLSQQLNNAILRLPAQQQALLRDPFVQDMVMFNVGEQLWQTLVPGHNISAHIDPHLSTVLMAHHLGHELNKLPVDWFTQQINHVLSQMDAESIALGRELLNTQELGPNLRIDAAKDVGNLQRVTTLSGSQRRDAFLEEVDKAKDFWQQVLAPSRALYPPMSVIAELTDLEALAGSKNGAKQAQKAFNQVFTGTPDLDQIFSWGYQLIHHSPTPHQYGDSQRYLGSTEYGLTGFIPLLKQRAQALPLSAQLQYQNLVSSHDYATTSHNLLHNPAIAVMDQTPYWGLENDWHQVRKELDSKPCFLRERHQLKQAGVNDLGRTLYLFEQRAKHLLPQLSQELQTCWSLDSKKADKFIAPTPADLKRRFVQEVLNHSTLNDLELSTEQAKTAFEAVLIARLTEPSEIRAMRATLNNTWLDTLKQHPDWRPLTVHLYNAFDKIVAKDGRHTGYQAFDNIIDKTINALPEHVLADLQPTQTQQTQANSAHPSKTNKPAEGNKLSKMALKQALWQQAMPPVLDKLLRMLAIQVGSPGIPSIYMQDFYPPSGGETVKNQMVQNRTPISLTHTPEGIKAYQQQAMWLLGLRQHYPALDNGILLNPMSKHTEYMVSNQGVIPFIRDNGEQQVILLVNTGSPAEGNWANRVGDEAHYPAFALQKPVVKDLDLNLWHMGLPEGTRYRDAQTGHGFVINHAGRLVSEKNPNQGPSVEQAVLLVREN